MIGGVCQGAQGGRPALDAGARHRPAAELELEGLTAAGVVIDHEHTQALQLLWPGVRDAGKVVHLHERNLEREHRALTGRAGQGDLALHHLHQLSGDRQAQAGAAVAPRGRAVGLGKGAEHAGMQGLVDADAGVPDLEAQARLLRIRVHQADANDDLTAVGELDRVAHQIGEDLAHAHGVALEFGRQIMRQHADHLQAFGCGRARAKVAHVLHELARAEADVLDLELAGLDLGEVEHVVDEAQQVLAGLVHRIGEAALLRVQRRVVQQLGHAEDAVHRRANLVTHGGEELALASTGRFGGFLSEGKVMRTRVHHVLKTVALAFHLTARDALGLLRVAPPVNLVDQLRDQGGTVQGVGGQQQQDGNEQHEQGKLALAEHQQGGDGHQFACFPDAARQGHRGPEPEFAGVISHPLLANPLQAQLDKVGRPEKALLRQALAQVTERKQGAASVGFGAVEDDALAVKDDPVHAHVVADEPAEIETGDHHPGDDRRLVENGAGVVHPRQAARRTTRQILVGITAQRGLEIGAVLVVVALERGVGAGDDLPARIEQNGQVRTEAPAEDAKLQVVLLSGACARVQSDPVRGGHLEQVETMFVHAFDAAHGQFKARMRVLQQLGTEVGLVADDDASGNAEQDGEQQQAGDQADQTATG